LGPYETEAEAQRAEQDIVEKGQKLIEEDQLKDSSEDGNSRD